MDLNDRARSHHPHRTGPANLDTAVAAGSCLGSRHPLFLTATTTEILFLITFSVCATVIDTDPIYAAILESVVDRTVAPELLLLIAFLVYATIIDVMGTWRREVGFHGCGVVAPEAVMRQPSPPLSTPRLGGSSSGETVLRVGM
jgi:hypothetical protein